MITRNQYFQYTARMPMEDEYGLYFDQCVEAPYIITGEGGKVLAVCYSLIFIMAWMIIMLLCCTDWICATICRRGRYEEIN